MLRVEDDFLKDPKDEKQEADDQEMACDPRYWQEDYISSASDNPKSHLSSSSSSSISSLLDTSSDGDAPVSLSSASSSSNSSSSSSSLDTSSDDASVKTSSSNQSEYDALFKRYLHLKKQANLSEAQNSELIELLEKMNDIMEKDVDRLVYNNDTLVKDANVMIDSKQALLDAANDENDYLTKLNAALRLQNNDLRNVMDKVAKDPNNTIRVLNSKLRQYKSPIVSGNKASRLLDSLSVAQSIPSSSSSTGQLLNDDSKQEQKTFGSRYSEYQQLQQEYQALKAQLNSDKTLDRGHQLNLIKVLEQIADIVSKDVMGLDDEEQKLTEDRNRIQASYEKRLEFLREEKARLLSLNSDLKQQNNEFEELFGSRRRFQIDNEEFKKKLRKIKQIPDLKENETRYSELAKGKRPKGQRGGPVAAFDIDAALKRLIDITKHIENLNNKYQHVIPSIDSSQASQSSIPALPVVSMSSTPAIPNLVVIGNNNIINLGHFGMFSGLPAMPLTTPGMTPSRGPYEGPG